MRPSVQSYIFGGMQRIEGYLCVDDALLIACLMRWQTHRGLSGGAAEIGIYFGRLYFLLRLLMARGERAFAADLFDIDPKPAGPSGQLRRFRDNAARLGLKIADDDLHVGDSALLSGEEIRQRAGPIRFFSIDGGHGYAEVAHDAAVARHAIAPHGVICFDDFCNPYWPEVSAAAFEFLRTDDVAPICISRKKLYCGRRAFAAQYREALRRSELIAGLVREQDQRGMFADDVVYVGSASERYAFERLLERIKLGRLSSLLYAGAALRVAAGPARDARFGRPRRPASLTAFRDQ